MNFVEQHLAPFSGHSAFWAAFISALRTSSFPLLLTENGFKFASPSSSSQKFDWTHLNSKNKQTCQLGLFDNVMNTHGPMYSILMYISDSELCTVSRLNINCQCTSKHEYLQANGQGLYNQVHTTTQCYINGYCLIHLLVQKCFEHVQSLSTVYNIC